MSRILTSLGCMAIAVLLVAEVAAGDDAPKTAPVRSMRVVASPGQGGVQVYQVGPGGAYQVGGSGVPSLPGYYQLSRPNVQKELELVPEQIEKLKQIGEEYRKKYSELTGANQGGMWKDWQKLTAEERKAKSAEYREKYAELSKQAAAEVEKVLLPHQLERLKELDFNSRAAYYLRSPWALKQINISDNQKEQLDKIREEMTQQYEQLQKKALEDALKVLTPEQVEQLKKQIQQQYR